MNNQTYCGYVAIMGRPNVGKSTLLNAFLGEKISITSRKPQTTRQQIRGILTQQNKQVIFVDTPGLHDAKGHALHRLMNRAARSALQDVNLILFVVEALKWTDQEDWIIDQLLSKTRVPVFLVINKIDEVKNKDYLLPFIERIQSKFNFSEILPISAEFGKKVPELLALIFSDLPESEHYFPADQTSDRDASFRATEVVREKLIRYLGDELPYAVGVQMNTFERTEKLISIHMTLWVERPGQKAIVIGKDGRTLKTIGTKARQELEELFKQKVYLNLWVKVKSSWTDDPGMLNQLGYGES